MFPIIMSHRRHGASAPCIKVITASPSSLNITCSDATISKGHTYILRRHGTKVIITSPSSLNMMPPSPRVMGCVTGEKGWRQARGPCTQVICALCTVRCALRTVRALCTQVICALCAPITVTAHSSVCSVFYSWIVDCITWC